MKTMAVKTGKKGPHMADVKETPKIKCDNCGFVDHKEILDWSAEWRKKDGWGGVRVDATKRSTYPDNIAMIDLCPHCLRLVHKAVTGALAEGRKCV